LALFAIVVNIILFFLLFNFIRIVCVLNILIYNIWITVIDIFVLLILLI